jgi:hypothetical protein
VASAQGVTNVRLEPLEAINRFVPGAEGKNIRRCGVLCRRSSLTQVSKEREWAIVDSNHGPPPYQSGALTN